MFSNVFVVQTNSIVGDIEGNLQHIAKAYAQAVSARASIAVFPELAICGYPPQDLVHRPAFRKQCEDAVAALCELTKASDTALLIGGIETIEGAAYNTVYFIARGAVVHAQHKISLPNYGVFDEKRVFTAGHALSPVEWNGTRYGMLICEDAWHPANTAALAQAGAERLIIINASPFERGKLARRHELAATIATRHHMPVLYVNMCGAQDDIIFDGASFACERDGKITCQFPQFSVSHALATEHAPLMREEETIWHAAMLGLKDYVEKNGFPGVLLGLSGGIDSAVVAALAADALGSGRVIGVRLPSPFTSDDSMVDAELSARFLDIKLLTVPIIPSLDASMAALSPALSEWTGGAEWLTNPAIGGNLQSRLRGIALMAISNASRHMLLSTGNKSEIAVGYSTLYGDSCGGYAPLKDIYKGDIYALAEWRNAHIPHGGKCAALSVIPARSITKAPSAELKPGQKDADQLPPYPVLDGILRMLVEGLSSVEETIQAGYARETVLRVYGMLKAAEFKRAQSPLGPKVGGMLFGRDWRYPLTNKFKG